MSNSRSSLVIIIHSMHKVSICKEYHSVCSLVGTGTLPTPLSPASVHLPPNRGGRGGTLACGLGVGEEFQFPNSDDWRKSLALCLLCDSIGPNGSATGQSGTPMTPYSVPIAASSCRSLCKMPVHTPWVLPEAPQVVFICHFWGTKKRLISPPPPLPACLAY